MSNNNDTDSLFDELDINNPFEVKDNKRLSTIYNALKEENAKNEKAFLKELKQNIQNKYK
jgi:hypothetical protein